MNKELSRGLILEIISERGDVDYNFLLYVMVNLFSRKSFPIWYRISQSSFGGFYSPELTEDLNALKGEGLIKEVRRGGKKFYTLTAMGRESVPTYTSEIKKIIRHEVESTSEIGDETLGWLYNFYWNFILHSFDPQKIKEQFQEYQKSPC